MNEKGFVKIMVPFETSIPGELERESLWASAMEDGYELENIPFYVQSLALRDVVAVNKASDGGLDYDHLVRASGHSTIRLWFTDEADVQGTRDQLRAMGCESEVSDLPRLVAVDIPSSIRYRPVKAFLVAGEKANVFEYEEGCLADNHGAILLDQFLAQECTAYVRRLLEDAITDRTVALPRFEFNRFEVTIERDNSVVVLEDVLDPTETGTERVPLNDFAHALARCSA